MKNNVKYVRRKATNWEEIFAKDISDKGSLSKIHNKALKLNKTTNNYKMAEEKNKMAKDLNRHPTKEDIPMEKCI